MNTDFKLNYLGQKRFQEKYAHSVETTRIAKPVIFVAIFFFYIAFVHIMYYLILISAVALFSYIGLRLKENGLASLKNNNYTITQHTLINAKRCFDSEDATESYRLYIDEASILPLDNMLLVSYEDYSRYASLIGQPIYLLHIGKNRHLVHREELENNYTYNYNY